VSRIGIRELAQVGPALPGASAAVQAVVPQAGGIPNAAPFAQALQDVAKRRAQESQDRLKALIETDPKVAEKIKAVADGAKSGLDVRPQQAALGDALVAAGVVSRSDLPQWRVAVSEATARSAVDAVGDAVRTDIQSGAWIGQGGQDLTLDQLWAKHAAGLTESGVFSDPAAAAASAEQAASERARLQAMYDQARTARDQQVLVDDLTRRAGGSVMALSSALASGDPSASDQLNQGLSTLADDARFSTLPQFRARFADALVTGLDAIAASDDPAAGDRARKTAAFLLEHGVVSGVKIGQDPLLAAAVGRAADRLDASAASDAGLAHDRYVARLRDVLDRAENTLLQDFQDGPDAALRKYTDVGLRELAAQSGADDTNRGEAVKTLRDTLDRISAPEVVHSSQVRDLWKLAYTDPQAALDAIDASGVTGPLYGQLLDAARKNLQTLPLWHADPAVGRQLAHLDDAASRLPDALPESVATDLLDRIETAREDVGARLAKAGRPGADTEPQRRMVAEANAAIDQAVRAATESTNQARQELARAATDPRSTAQDLERFRAAVPSSDFTKAAQTLDDAQAALVTSTYDAMYSSRGPFYNALQRSEVAKESQGQVLSRVDQQARSAYERAFLAAGSRSQGQAAGLEAMQAVYDKAVTDLGTIDNSGLLARTGDDRATTELGPSGERARRFDAEEALVMDAAAADKRPDVTSVQPDAGKPGLVSETATPDVTVSVPDLPDVRAPLRSAADIRADVDWSSESRLQRDRLLTLRAAVLASIGATTDARAQMMRDRAASGFPMRELVQGEVRVWSTQFGALTKALPWRRAIASSPKGLPATLPIDMHKVLPLASPMFYRVKAQTPNDQDSLDYWVTKRRSDVLDVLRQTGYIRAQDDQATIDKKFDAWKFAQTRLLGISGVSTGR
jgi:hypothetical protein